MEEAITHDLDKNQVKFLHIVLVALNTFFLLQMDV